MAVTAAAFKAARPEFASTDDALVSTAIAQAQREHDAAVFGESFDDVVSQYAAHILGMSPYGGKAGLRVGQGANQTSVYFERYRQLVDRFGGAYRYTGDSDL